jgi:ligand-binding sensor domain-containing protein
VQPSSLRTMTIVVTVILLGALGGVVWLVMQTNQSSVSRLPTPTPRATQVITLVATDQSAQPTPTPDNLETLADGGFAYAPLPGYSISRTDRSATLTGPATDGALNPVFLLSGGPPEQFVAGAADDLPTLFDEFVTYFAQQDDFEAGSPREVEVDGAPGLSVDIASRNAASGFAGRIVMAQPNAERLFVLVGVAPADQWEEDVSARYGELLDTIALLDDGGAMPDASIGAGNSATASATPGGPTQPTEPTPLPTAPATATAIAAAADLPTPPPQLAAAPGVSLLANANFASGATVAGDNLWAATEGGVMAWNRRSDGAVKFTTLDGLAGNHFAATAYCPLSGLGVVIGGDTGLQIFDTRAGRWNRLDTGNSAMSFDDVSALFCDAENGYLIVGYAQHGLDVFDAATSEWRHLDRNDGLGTDTVQHVVATGDRDAYWVSSGIGLSVIEGDEALLYNAANSPLEVAPLHGLGVGPGDEVWIAGTDRLYRVAGGEWRVYDAAALGRGFPTTNLAALAVSEQGDVWLVDEAAVVCRFDPTAERCVALYAEEAGMASGPVTGATVHTAVDGTTSFYYTTAGQGVSGFDGTAWRTYTAGGETLLDNAVHALDRDRIGFLWTALDGGVQQINPADPSLSWVYPEEDGLPVTNVRAIAPATVSGLWFGGENGAAQLLDDTWRHFTTADGLANDQVQALAADRQRRMWIGTRSGLSIWNGETFFNLTRDNGLPSDNITALQAGEDGMWIGTSNGGLYEFARNQLRVYNANNAGLLSDTVTALALAADGSVLVGSERGLARFVDGQAQPVAEVPVVPIRSLAVAGEQIWVGTAADGLYFFDGERWRHRTAADGLPSATLNALVVDPYGALWVGGASGGLLRMEK